MIKKMEIHYGEGKYSVTLLATATGNGFIIQLLGGEQPHVGAVILSIPRPSLADPAKTSCNSTVVPMLGHKDDELARPVAEEIARRCNQPVVLVAGVHVDNASTEDIKKLVSNCLKAVQMFLKKHYEAKT